MNGHVRKRGSLWEIVLELGEQNAQRCPDCIDARGRGRRYWSDAERLPACPKCGDEMVDVRERRQIVPPERYRTKKEAQQGLTRQLSADLNGVFVEPTKLTLRDFLTEHWLSDISGSVRVATLVKYRSHVERYILPFFEDSVLRRITPTAVASFNTSLRDSPRRPRRRRGGEEVSRESAGDAADDVETPYVALQPLSPASRRDVYVTLATALNAAVDQGFLSVNPASRVTTPKREYSREIQYWTKEETSRFLTARQDDRLHPLWRLLVMTGLRRGEALGLKWNDVDLAALRASVQRSRGVVGGTVIVQPPKTRTGRRSIRFDEATAKVLAEWKKRQAAERLLCGPAWLGGDALESDWVFTSERGLPPHPGSITKSFWVAEAKVDVKRIRLHDLRHTYATTALEAGVHVKVVQEQLGHATVAQTIDTYSFAIPSLHEAAAQKVAALVDGPL